MSASVPPRLETSRGRSFRTPAATQPAVGLIGLGFVAVTVALIGLAIGPMRSLQSLGPLTLYALPVIVVVAVWWEGRPFRNLSRPLGGLLDTALIAAIALALLAVGQALVGRSDLGHLLDISPPPAPPGAPAPEGELPFTAYPWTFVLGGAVFISMLQLTFVNGRWPLQRLNPVPGGVAALALSWAVGLTLYFLLADWSPIATPVVQDLLGLSDPGGPVNAFNFLGALTCVAVWQIVVFVALQGDPIARISSTAPRLVVANAAVVALGWLSFLVAKDVLDWTVPTIAGAAGCAIAAALLVALAFEGWPARNAGGPTAVSAASLAEIAVLGVALFFGLKALGNAAQEWNPRDPVELWMATTTLNITSGAVVLWSTVFGRWPAAPPEPPRDG